MSKIAEELARDVNAGWPIRKTEADGTGGGALSRKSAKVHQYLTAGNKQLSFDFLFPKR